MVPTYSSNTSRLKQRTYSLSVYVYLDQAVHLDNFRLLGLTNFVRPNIQNTIIFFKFFCIFFCTTYKVTGHICTCMYKGYIYFFETLEGAAGFGHKQLVLYQNHILVLIVNICVFLIIVCYFKDKMSLNYKRLHTNSQQSRKPVPTGGLNSQGNFHQSSLLVNRRFIMTDKPATTNGLNP